MVYLISESLLASLDFVGLLHYSAFGCPSILNVLNLIFVILLARCIAMEFDLSAQFENELFELGYGEQSLAYILLVLENLTNLLRCLADDRFDSIGETCCPTIGG